MAEEAKSRRQTVSEAAAAWVVRLSDPACTAADRQAFERWRAEAPEHEAAFEREARTWERSDRLRALRPAQAAADPDLLAPGAFEEDEPVHSAAPVRRWAAGFIAAVAVGGSVLWSLNAAPAYATGVGERRVVVLEDGTRVELNTNSRIVVRYASGERVIKLIKGEALFEVAPEARPLVVAARDKRLAAAGGAFNVRMNEAAVEVLVTEGAVKVADTDTPEAPPATASAGAAAVLSDEGGVTRPVQPQAMEKALAWRHGQIALDGQTLEAAAAEFNRYNKRRLVIADPSISAFRLGGYFRVDDMDGFVRAVETAFPVRAESRSQTIYLSAAG